MELLFGGSGSLFVYQMGVCKSWLEGVDKKRLKELRVGGVSGGSIVAAFFLATIHSEHDMDYWYFKHIRPAIIQTIQKQGDVSFHDAIKESAFELFNRFDDERHIYRDYFHIGLTVWKHLFPKPKIIKNLDKAQDFADAIACSCHIPFYTGKSLFSSFNSLQCLDGGLSIPVPRLNAASKCLFVSIFGIETFLVDHSNMNFLNLAKYGKYTLLDFHVTMDLKKYDFLYRRGVADGKNSARTFQAFIDL